MSRIVILKPDQSVELNPVDSGFAYGYGLFETIRLRAGRLCFWQAHWDRLAHSAASLGFHFKLEMPAVLDAIRSLCEAVCWQDGLIKLSLMSENGGSVLYVYGRPELSGTQSARLKLDLKHPLNERSVLAGHKTHNYMEHMLLLKAARERGYYDTLRVNGAGHLAESCVGNIFFIKGQTLATPSLESGILPGVVRGAILNLARSSIFNEAIPVEAGVYDPAFLKSCDAVFLTNSSVGILPIERIDAEGDSAMHFDSESHRLVQSLQQLLREKEEAESV